MTAHMSAAATVTAIHFQGARHGWRLALPRFRFAERRFGQAPSRKQLVTHDLRGPMSHILENAYVADDVRVAFPDYAAVLVAVTGLSGGPSDERSEALLQEAEVRSANLLATTALDDIPEVLAWRDAYASFGISL